MSNTRTLLRPPGWSRLWVVGFTTAWTVVVVGLNFHDDAIDPRNRVLLSGGILFAGGLAYRLVQQELRLEGEYLVVRNMLRTRRLHRQDIRRIWIGLPVTAPLLGGWTKPVGRAINIEPTRGKPFTVDVSHYLLGPAKTRERLEHAHQALAGWHAAGDS